MPQARIRDRATGKEILVDAKDLPKYGISMIPPAQKQDKNIFQKISDTFLPATKRMAETVTGSLALGKQSEATNNLLEQLNIRSKSLTDQAQQELDPRKKAEVQTMAKATNKEIAQSGKQIAGQRKQLKDTLKLESETLTPKNVAKTAGATAAEIGSFLYPGGGAKEGIKLTGKQAILKGADWANTLARNAIDGAITAGLFTLSDQEQQSLDKLMTGSAKGAGFNVGLGTVGKILSGSANYLFKTIPYASRAAAFGNVPTELIKESFEKGAPGSFKKLKSWAQKTGLEAERELQKVSVPEGFSLQDLFGDDPRAQYNALVATSDLKEHLRSINQLDDADNIDKLIFKMTTGNPLDLQESLVLKRAFDKGSSFAKGQATEKMAEKVALRTNISNAIRESIRSKSDEAAKLLDVEHFSKSIQPFAEKAENQGLKKGKLNLYEINTLLFGLPIAFGASAYTGNPILAAIPIAGLAAYRAINDPRITNFLYRTGQTTEKITQGTTQDRLRQFLKTGVTQQITK